LQLPRFNAAGQCHLCKRLATNEFTCVRVATTSSKLANAAQPDNTI
jgi:hypothetical protein